ncbi:MAG: YafY family transcriptional regulator [Firmicutes bacterium]|nr:YafY family transcriptional regulator [Bacillota bacterium]
MKTHRLLSIVIHLLNHDTATAAQLARRFEVSKRTILRDMEQLSMAGIPIQSLPGVNGGYSIMEGYKLKGQLITPEEQASIITALKGFTSARHSKKYDEVLEKISSLLTKPQKQHIFLDFGASGENDELQQKLKFMENAIINKTALHISYVNALGVASGRLVEPVALNYRWYAWYLLAFCTVKQEYRIFKAARISRLKPTGTPFSREHKHPDILLEKTFDNGKRSGLTVALLCKSCIEVQIREYLSGNITETFENGDFIMEIYVMEDERMWFAMLLSFGNMVEVLVPAGLKARLVETAKNILSLYS